jgi:hypothetical protein
VSRRKVIPMTTDPVVEARVRLTRLLDLITEHAPPPVYGPPEPLPERPPPEHPRIVFRRMMAFIEEREARRVARAARKARR